MDFKLSTKISDIKEVIVKFRELIVNKNEKYKNEDF